MHLCVLLEAAKLSSQYIRYKSFFLQTMSNSGQDIVLNLKERLKKISMRQNIDEWIFLFLVHMTCKFFLLVGKDNKRKAITQEILL